MTAEEQRLLQSRADADWKTWGPYLSERAWGTVREDYSPDGSAWTYFPHDHARSRAYRWNEDGLLGFSDRRQILCFALALWNGRDPILKERAFGLSGPEGNHGEDVKEYFYFLDSTPTHSYMKALYKYPQAAFPYDRLVHHGRSRAEPELELIDTGIFDQDRYFDVQVEYAKADPDDILIRITATNRGPDPADLDILPTLWFRNTWSWARDDGAGGTARPTLCLSAAGAAIRAAHPQLGDYTLQFDLQGGPDVLFTENDTNVACVFHAPNPAPYVKDAFGRYLIHNESAAINPARSGTKAAILYRLHLAPGASAVIRLRLARSAPTAAALGPAFNALFDQRQREADEFYNALADPNLCDDLRLIQRQAFAGILWSKQFYNYDVRQWLTGDPACPPPPDARWQGRNHDWQHIANDSVLSMPDTWEYPWYAAWDLAFHTIPLAQVDPDFAKRQLILLLREWFMHPSGQLPAYEWAFGDVNPPVHAWAALRVFRIERKARGGQGDRLFLERVFQKLLINFTWWINRKDRNGRNLFQGGFLGLDNIGLFDRSAKLPSGYSLDQSDGTAWMAMYCLNMLAMAIELAREDPAYEDVATKFLEHFFYIAHAMNDRPATRVDDGVDLWDPEDRFYYDVLHVDGQHRFLKVRSMVGLIPLLAVETIESDTLERLPDFARRLEWFLANRADLCENVASLVRCGRSNRRLFSIVGQERLRAILTRTLDESEFLSPFGLRSVSRYHQDHPAELIVDGQQYRVDYEPAESTTGLFGGNSNWRGPIWFPLNYLIIEALQKFDYYYGDSFKIDCPTGSHVSMTLWEVATCLSHRLMGLFARDESGRRPVFGGVAKFQNDPHWRDLIPFHEYFHGDNGCGLGAAHQTGWTALIAKLIQQSGGARPRA